MRVTLILLLALLSLTGCESGRATQSEPATRTVEATPVRVIDGDTFEARVDGEVETVRMAGIDAPELNQEGYEATSFYLWSLLCDLESVEHTGEVRFGGEKTSVEAFNGCPDPSNLLLVVPPRDRDDHGRLIAWTMIEQGTDLISADMLVGDTKKTGKWYFTVIQ